MFAILKHWHPMLGQDMHIPWPPAAPVPALTPVPYRTFSLLIGSTGGLTTQSYFLTHLTGGAGVTMSNGTDIGPLIPHIGLPSITMPIEFATSSSKSYFGASTYLGFDNKKIQNSVAVALLLFVNPNLNCGIPAPTLGYVLAPNTHCAMMTVGDIVSGLLKMWLDRKLQTLITKWALGGELASSISKRLGYRYFASKAAAKAFLRAQQVVVKGNIINEESRRLLATSSPGSRLVGPLASAAVGFFLGAPTGMDAGSFGGTTPYGAVHDFFDPPTEGDPSAPPPTPTYGDYFRSSDGGIDGAEGAPSDGGLTPGGVPEEPAGGAGSNPDAGVAAADNAASAPDPGVRANSSDAGAPNASTDPADASAGAPDAGIRSPDANASDAGARIPGGAGTPSGGTKDPDGGGR